MAKTNKADMSCARVKQYTAFDVSKAERHNERKNETYENMNVITERIALNVHFKKPTVPTYMEQLKQMETDGLVSLRGLRKDATLFNEIVIDVNTMYFERNGGYEYPWLLAAGQHNAVHHRCCDLVLRAEKGTHPPSSGVPDANSRCLRAGASLRAGFPNCLLFGMAGFSADSCNWHIALLRHAAGIEHLLRW